MRFKYSYVASCTCGTMYKKKSYGLYSVVWDDDSLFSLSSIRHMVIACLLGAGVSLPIYKAYILCAAACTAHACVWIGIHIPVNILAKNTTHKKGEKTRHKMCSFFPVCKAKALAAEELLSCLAAI